VATEQPNLPSSVPSWVVVNTHAHREHIAIDNLARQGFESYCPLVKRRRSHARRITTVARPLFPSYLFVRIHPELGRWRPILSTLGVRTLVRFGDQLGVLDHRFIEELRKREEEGFIVRPAEPYQVGQRVKLQGGPFDGIVAKIISLQDNDRIVVLMDLLQQSVRAQVSIDQVQPG
jgi:transcriptional antiterminator RfaH